MSVDLSAFANPWEHARLLSDAPRNARLLELLARRAPGARVLEVGCGTGLLSCVAARLGATEVWAVEPTGITTIARALVAANGLGGVVRVVEARVQDLPPAPVDLAFSELLNADPFAEGVLDAMEAAARWVRPGGCLAPRRLRVWAALARLRDPAREAQAAAAEVRRAASTYGLVLDPLLEGLAGLGAYRYTGSDVPLAGPPVLLWDLEVGSGGRPAPIIVHAVATEPGPVGGAVVWFEATLDDGLALGNAPGAGGHWGQLVCAWPAERGLRAGETIALQACVDTTGMTIAPSS